MENKIERQIYLTFLCGINALYIGEKWSVSKTFCMSKKLIKRSYEWNDPLVEFYRQTDNRDRKRNAIHIYLTFEGENDGLRGSGSINIENDRLVYDAVYSDIFHPRTERLIKETNLERIIASTPFSRQESFLRAILGQKVYTQTMALKVATPILYQKLREAYNQVKMVNINRIYDRVADDIYKKLKKGLNLAENQKIKEYAKAIE